MNTGPLPSGLLALPYATCPDLSAAELQPSPQRVPGAVTHSLQPAVLPLGRDTPLAGRRPERGVCPQEEAHADFPKASSPAVLAHGQSKRPSSHLPLRDLAGARPRGQCHRGRCTRCEAGHGPWTPPSPRSPLSSPHPTPPGLFLKT